MATRRHAHGFTLLEAIVTLVIVALIVTVLMQALAQSLDMRTRLLHHQRQTRMSALQEQWFRDTVASAIADLPDALGHMHGSADTLELVTAAPLGGGGLQRVRWSLLPVEGGYALHYSDATWPDLTVLRGPVFDAAFAYLDAEGQWQSEWEPAEDATEEAVEVLPRMVRLHASTATGELLWLVPIAGSPYPPAMLRLGGDDGI